MILLAGYRLERGEVGFGFVNVATIRRLALMPQVTCLNTSAKGRIRPQPLVIAPGRMAWQEES